MAGGRLGCLLGVAVLNWCGLLIFGDIGGVRRHQPLFKAASLLLHHHLLCLDRSLAATAPRSGWTAGAVSRAAAPCCRYLLPPQRSPQQQRQGWQAQTTLCLHSRCRHLACWPPAHQQAMMPSQFCLWRPHRRRHRLRRDGRRWTRVHRCRRLHHHNRQQNHQQHPRRRRCRRSWRHGAARWRRALRAG